MTPPGTGALWRGGAGVQEQMWPSVTGGADVAPNGAVAFSALVDAVETVFWYTGGSLQEIGPGTAPTTDGQSLAYVHGGRGLVLRDLAGNEQLVDAGGSRPVLRGGYLGYLAPHDGTLGQIWVRRPDGTQTALTGPLGGHLIEALSPSGKLIFSSPETDGEPVHYLAVPPYGTGDTRRL